MKTRNGGFRLSKETISRQHWESPFKKSRSKIILLTPNSSSKSSTIEFESHPANPPMNPPPNEANHPSRILLQHSPLSSANHRFLQLLSLNNSLFILLLHTPSNPSPIDNILSMYLAVPSQNKPINPPYEMKKPVIAISIESIFPTTLKNPHFHYLFPLLLAVKPINHRLS